MADSPILTQILVKTEEGEFVLGVDETNAPITAANFLAYVDGSHLTNSSVYRIVTLSNQPADTRHKIEVFQWGWRASEEAPDQPFPPIAHEPTSKTALRHKDGTLSMARRDPGTAGPGFFICIGDQPELDEGGMRNPDGAGFAAFGQVLRGAETIKRIFARSEDVEYLNTPVAIFDVRRVEERLDT